MGAISSHFLALTPKIRIGDSMLNKVFPKYFFQYNIYMINIKKS